MDMHTFAGEHPPMRELTGDALRAFMKRVENINDLYRQILTAYQGSYHLHYPDVKPGGVIDLNYDELVKFMATQELPERHKPKPRMGHACPGCSANAAMLIQDLANEAKATAEWLATAGVEMPGLDGGGA